VRFKNPASGDFRVTERSEEVFRLGFQNFAMDRFGVESERLKALAEKPEMPVPVYHAEMIKEETLVWESATIKNLATMSERSATGMDSERGVYIVSTGAYDNELRDYLKSNDVILGFAGAAVNNLDDLYRAIAGADLSEPQEMIVFRAQKEHKMIIRGGVIRTNIR
jgi:hypothetical protein